MDLVNIEGIFSSRGGEAASLLQPAAVVPFKSVKLKADRRRLGWGLAVHTVGIGLVYIPAGSADKVLIPTALTDLRAALENTAVIQSCHRGLRAPTIEVSEQENLLGRRSPHAENGLPILLFALDDPENIVKAACGEAIGTIINN